MVSPATFRHPSMLAKIVTTADHISGGRIDLGLGAGWHEREHEAYGFPFAPTKERMDVLEEQLEIVLGNWSRRAVHASRATTTRCATSTPSPSRSSGRTRR